MINARFFAAKSELQRTLIEASRTSKIAISVCFASDAKNTLLLRGHFVTKLWTIKSLTIGCFTDVVKNKESSENIAKWINDKLQEFYLISGAVIAVVHCNDISVQNGVNMLAEAYSWHSFLCCRSVLRYITENLYNESFVSKDIDEIEQIVRFFSNSEAGKTLIQRAQEKRNNVGHSRNEDAIHYPNISKSKNSNTQDKADFKAARSLLRVLRPLDAALLYLQNSEFVPSSSIPILLSGLEKKLCSELDMPLKAIKEEDDNGISVKFEEIENQLKQKLLEELRNVTMFTANDVTTMAAALDPRYKKLSFINSDEKQAVYSMISAECYFLHKDDSKEDSDTEEPPSKIQMTDNSRKTPANTLMDDILKLGAGCQEEEEHHNTNQEILLNHIKKEMDSYFAEKIPGSEICPLGWWRANHSKYPMMSRVARLYLCIPAVADYSLAQLDETYVSPICEHVSLCKADKVLLPK